MNEENTNPVESVEPVVNETTETREAFIAELQDEVEQLQDELSKTQEALAGAMDAARVTAAPAGDADLRALATTVRTCLNNGHPDVAKHVNTLLSALGAPPVRP